MVESEFVEHDQALSIAREAFAESAPEVAPPDVEATAKRIAERMSTDAAFREHLREHPLTALTEAGLSAEYAHDFMAEVNHPMCKSDPGKHYVSKVISTVKSYICF